MTWREEIKAITPSFRGVPFKSTEASAQVGRRNVVHEYPQRDKPYVEDLGEMAKRWEVSGYVNGDDYLAQRDALLDALTQPGPGELVHPRYGVLQVCVLGVVSVQESHLEGGTAYFRFTVVDAGINQFPAAQDDTAAAVDAAAAEYEAVAETQFAELLNVAGPATIVQGAIERASGIVGELLGTVQRVTSLDALSAVVGSVTALSGNLAALIRTPVVFAQQLRSIHGQLVSGVRRPVSAISELQAVFTNQARPTKTAPAGSTRAKILGNHSAIGDLERAFSLAGQARLVSVAVTAGADPTFLGGSAAAFQLQEPPVTTAVQAVRLRDQVFAQMDEELEANEPPPQAAAALEKLRTAVARDVAARAELLRERSTLQPMTVLPALVLAHRAYQDAGRAEELIARNGLRHPGFTPANPLEVLQ